MGYFKQPEFVEVKLKNADYWVKLVGDLKYGDLKSFAVDGTNGEIDFATSADKLLLVVIKEWNLDDENGEILPITQENIDRLEKDDAITIIEKAGGIIDTDEQKKTSK